MSGPNLFTIPAGADFAQSLARGLIARVGSDPLALPRTLIYLPTRRAARNFGEAFASVLGGSALLPQFRALGDSEEDDLAFDALDEGLDLSPAITPIRRQLLLATLVRRWDEQARGRRLGMAQALGLADSLAALMDEIERQGATLDRLHEMAPPALAAHWQQVLQFLDLIQDEWPGVLKAENVDQFVDELKTKKRGTIEEPPHNGETSTFVAGPDTGDSTCVDRSPLNATFPVACTAGRNEVG